MAQIHVRKEPYGWRIYLEGRGRARALSGYYEDETAATTAALRMAND
jgi:hypothetical protein